MSADEVRGRAWAEGVYQEKLANPASLPNLGPGYPKELRAARAVASIAQRKLYISGKAPGVRQELRLPPHQKAFWRAVLERANELAVAASEGA